MELSRLTKAEAERVRTFFLFKNAGADLTDRVLRDKRCELAEYPRGAVIYSAENYRRSVGYILDGAIRVSKTAQDAHRYIMNTLNPGSCFGAAAVFCDCGDYVTVLEALAPCRIVFFPQALLESLMTESPAAAMNYVAFLSDRIRFLNGRIQGLISASAGEALAGFLLDAAAEASGVTTVRLGSSLSALADRLNIGRSSLYRALGELERLALIARDGRNIRILDPDGLARYV